MDILFFALLAFYTFFKLSKHLGKVDEEEKKRIEEKIALMKAAQSKMQDILGAEKIVGAASTAGNQNRSAEDKSFDNLDDSTKSNLNQILSRCNIDLSFFLNGAKSAFEMVIKSFSTADLPTLKMLLSEKLYSGFEGAVNQRQSEEKTLTTNLIAIEKSDIISASVIGNEAVIAIKFTSKQINYVSSKDGEIIEGDKSEIIEVTDSWTFKKDLNSSNPNWVISGTGI